NRWRAVAFYIPALVLLVWAAVVFSPLAAFSVISSALSVFGLNVRGVSVGFVRLFYTVSYVHFNLALLASAFLLVRTYWTARNALVRQQLKWVVWGTVLAVAPVTLLYGVVYLLGASTDRWLTDVAVVPL